MVTTQILPMQESQSTPTLLLPPAAPGVPEKAVYLLMALLHSQHPCPCALDRGDPTHAGFETLMSHHISQSPCQPAQAQQGNKSRIQNESRMK